MPWSTSTRSQRLPANWQSIRAQVEHRADGHCQAQHHHPDCTGTGTECDHIVNNDDHSLPNLQWLSTPCHKAKTLTEASHARPRERRQPEKHPGRT